VISNGKGTPFFCAEYLKFLKVMNKKKQELLSFCPDDGTLERYLDTLNLRKRNIDWLYTNSNSFSQWSTTVTKLALSEIQRKKEEQIPYEEEKEVLENVAFFFNKLSYFKDMLNEWNKELGEDKEEIEELIKKLGY
jgi:hypothetical protein